MLIKRLFFILLFCFISRVNKNVIAAPIDSVYQESKFVLPVYKVIIPTFLGNNHRNFYGNQAPDALEVIWKLYLGQGKTVISRKLGTKIWAGAGWTGQPLLVQEDSSIFLMQGAYDHHLKKINASTGKLIWQYEFDDVVKGTGTIWSAPKCLDPQNRLIVLQGTRLGVNNFLDSRHVPSFRAISYFTGKELWRLDIKWTDSYSRDCDGSALVLKDTVYIGLENSLFTLLSPFPKDARIKDSMLQPEIFQETKLYTDKDVVDHKNNVVTESSASVLNNIVYITSGSGHVFGYSLKDKKLVWDFYTGSDMDGSAVVTNDSCIIVTVEKQYITGQGGVFKLDPSKPPEQAVKWYFPTISGSFELWEGGVIGSVGVNDYYNSGNLPNIVAISAVDGNLYVVDRDAIDSSKMVDGPRFENKYSTPKLLFKCHIGCSISTPIVVNNKIIAAGYDGINLFEFDKALNFTKIGFFEAPVESTPIVYNGRLFIASRDGYLYCLGKKL
jgi:outer membrane protein assembly factor BamB